MPTELTWRPITRADLDELFVLISRIQDHDRENERLTRADLGAMANQPWLDLSLDSLMAVDSGGIPRAWGRTGFRPGDTSQISVHLMGGVDPGWRSRGLGRKILEWQSERAPHNVAALRADRDVPAQIGGFVEDHLLDRRRLFEAAGFEATRWFTEMRCPIKAGGAPVPELSPPLLVEPFGKENSERIRQAHNISFAEHWAFTVFTPQTWGLLLEDEAFRPELSFAIVDPSVDGRPVVAFVLNAEYEQDWHTAADKEGYTEYLGVVPEWRSHGLASHLLGLSAARFVERGHPFAALGVDTDNATGALALYESLGYESVQGATYFSKAV